ncbi:hypothetical protein Kkor_0322 [Kangiella koreensis DSM 16069]|uniref:Uncharacterized protein n=2 Tax=Kangiella TaxID=261963 RepID=C7R7J4_KANKD|nr:hypothetical protein Kkor_0322 [Kangiella koreensis DSM 16069]
MDMDSGLPSLFNFSSNESVQRSDKRLYWLRILSLISAVFCVPIVSATCTAPSGVAPPPGVWDAHMNEIVNMGTLQRADFQIGDQVIYRIRKRGDEGTRDPMLERLRSIAPALKELQAYFATPPDRAVLLVESELDLLGDTLAFTQCAKKDEKHDLSNYVDEGEDLDVKLPEGLCLIVVRPHTIVGERKTRFALAHEWMHSMQNGAYRPAMRELWWVEGAAEWAAHKVVPGATERDNKIEQFFERQPECSLTQHSYDAQPFFFWGDQQFDTSWGISLGMGGREYLKEPRRAAEILPPERWLDWAIAQAEQTITMPDGRPLPFQAEVESLELGETCGAKIEGPPLSVQLREVTFPEGSASPLTIAPGDAQLAYKDSEDNWIRVTETVELEPSSSPVLFATIMPSGDDLNVNLTLDNTNGLTCGCHIGRWTEVATADPEAEDTFDGALEAIEMYRAMVPPEQLADLEKAKRMIEAADTKDRFRFRGAAKQIFEMDGGTVTFDNDGPIVTLARGGSFIIEDPHMMSDGKTTVDYNTYTHSGLWKIEDGILKIDLQKFTYEGTAEGPLSDGPQEISGSNKHSSYVGGGGDWVVSCQETGIKLVPAYEGERGPGRDAVLRPH